MKASGWNWSGRAAIKGQQFGLHERQRDKKWEQPDLVWRQFLQILNTDMNVKIKADNISEELRMDTIIPGSIIPILDRIKRILKEMRVLAARSELTSINIEFHADSTHRVNQRREELLRFLLQSRAPGREAFIIYVKLLLSVSKSPWRIWRHRG